MGESVFKITDVSKAFSRKKEKQVILDKFSFSAAPQEVIGIMGPSGCGKTTLLKILGGITQADEGSLLFLEQTARRKCRNPLNNASALSSRRIIFSHGVP